MIYYNKSLANLERKRPEAEEPSLMRERNQSLTIAIALITITTDRKSVV